MGKIVLFVLTLSELLAAYAVFLEHFTSGGGGFGSSSASLTIVAFAINTVAWSKYGQMHCTGNCSKKK